MTKFHKDGSVCPMPPTDLQQTVLQTDLHLITILCRVTVKIHSMRV